MTVTVHHTKYLKRENFAIQITVVTCFLENDMRSFAIGRQVDCYFTGNTYTQNNHFFDSTFLENRKSFLPSSSATVSRDINHTTTAIYCYIPVLHDTHFLPAYSTSTTTTPTTIIMSQYTYTSTSVTSTIPSEEQPTSITSTIPSDEQSTPTRKRTGL